MPLFLIERGFAEAVELETEAIEATVAYNERHELRWLFSFLSADKRKSYCVYEGPDAEAIRAQADALGWPADVVVEVGEVNPELFAQGGSISGHPAR